MDKEPNKINFSDLLSYLEENNHKINYLHKNINQTSEFFNNSEVLMSFYKKLHSISYNLALKKNHNNWLVLYITMLFIFVFLTMFNLVSMITPPVLIPCFLLIFLGICNSMNMSYFSSSTYKKIDANIFSFISSLSEEKILKTIKIANNTPLYENTSHDFLLKYKKQGLLHKFKMFVSFDYRFAYINNLLAFFKKDSYKEYLLQRNNTKTNIGTSTNIEKFANFLAFFSQNKTSIFTKKSKLNIQIKIFKLFLIPNLVISGITLFLSLIHSLSLPYAIGISSILNIPLIILGFVINFESKITPNENDMAFIQQYQSLTEFMQLQSFIPSLFKLGIYKPDEFYQQYDEYTAADFIEKVQSMNEDEQNQILQLLIAISKEPTNPDSEPYIFQ